MLEDGFVLAFGIEPLSSSDRKNLQGQSTREMMAIAALRAASAAGYQVQAEMAKTNLGANVAVAVATGELSVGLYGSCPRVFGAVGSAIDSAVQLSGSWLLHHSQLMPGLVLQPEAARIIAAACPGVLASLWGQPRDRLRSSHV